MCKLSPYWRDNQKRICCSWAFCYGPSKQTVTFVSTGEQPRPTTKKTLAGILSSGRDWKLLVKVEHQLKFTKIPFVTTTLRPDFFPMFEPTKNGFILLGIEGVMMKRVICKTATLAEKA